MVTITTNELRSLSLSMLTINDERNAKIERQTPAAPYWATQQNRIDLDDMNADRIRHFFGWEKVCF